MSKENKRPNAQKLSKKLEKTIKFGILYGAKEVDLKKFIKRLIEMN